MRIVFLTHYFPPESNAPANRVSDLARYWVSKGHEVTVVTCHPNHPLGKIYEGYTNRFYSRDEWNGVEILRLWTIPPRGSSSILQTLNYVVYTMLATTAAAVIEKSDVLVATSPHIFAGLGGTLLGKLFRRKMIVEIRDLWPETFDAVGVVRSDFTRKNLERLELWMYRNAGHIVTVTHAFKADMIERGIDPGKITVIPNGIDTQTFSPETIQPLPRTELGLEDKFVVSYIGTIGRCQRIPSLVGVFERLEDHPSIAFVVMGGGAELAVLQTEAGSRSLTNVHILGHQPAERARAMLAATDVSLVHLQKSDVFKKVIPSKLFESMGLSKPIVLGVEGEAAAILADAGAGIAVEPENVDEHVAAIRRLHQNPDEARRMGDRGREYVEKNFDRADLAQKYLELMERFAGVSVVSG